MFGGNTHLSHFNKSLEIDPNETQAYFYLGIIYAKEGNLTQAISAFNKALAIDPNYKEAYDNRAKAYLLLKKEYRSQE